MDKKMNQAILHTGTNLGDRLQQLLTANRHIEKRLGKLLDQSAIYQTKPWGIADQPDFLNQALIIETALDPFDLLDEIQAIEKDMGRVREVKWGARCIDIDILFYNDLILNTERLTIPHPFLHYRNFVLVPLLDIASQHIHPIFKMNIARLYEFSKDPLVVVEHSMP